MVFFIFRVIIVFDGIGTSCVLGGIICLVPLWRGISRFRKLGFYCLIRKVLPFLIIYII